jgi:hypothetical protein
MNPRIAATWGLAALACVAIASGFQANEPGPQPADGARAASAARVAGAEHAELRRAQPSRGETGLLVPADAASAALARVTPGAPPSAQPAVSAAR